MAYDEVGNLSESINFNGQTSLYTYDVNNRLTLIDYADGLSEAFTYDIAGIALRAAKPKTAARPR